MERKWRERAIASHSPRALFIPRKKNGNGRRVYRLTWIDFRSTDPLLLAPTSPAPATRDKLFPRARSRRRHELFQLEPANSQGRSRCLAMEEEGRGKRGRRVDKRRKKEWKIVIHGRYRLCPPLPPLPRFPNNLLIVLLIQEQEISSFDASNLF